MHTITLSTLLEHKSPVIHSVSCTATIAEAVREMNRHKIGSVIVMDGGALAGIFTERDVLTRVVCADLDPKTTPVSQVMTSGVLTVSPETTIEEVMNLFHDKRCRHLPVLDHGRLAGVISIGDISRFMAGVHAMECEQLKQYIAGGYPT
jgi:CBS domain-containing protein